jgi:predicted lipid carrier protein YhbT
MDQAYFERLLVYARSVNWGEQSQAPAPSAKVPPFVDAYFREFLTAKMHQQLLPDLRRLTASFGVCLKEAPGEHWSVSIVRGALESVTRNGIEAQCSFLVDAPVFSEIVAGRLSPKQAFFSRRIEIGGDIETGLKLATVLAAFFRQFPFEAKGDSRG